MKFKILALLLALTVLGTGAGLASDKVWVGLYLADNAEPAAEATLAPEKMHHRLHAVFGFKYYQLVKSQEFDLNQDWEHWAVPRKDFFIRVEPLPRKPNGPKIVDYEIYKDGFIVAKGTYEPHIETPVFINGPDFKDGRFIFVLEAR